MRKLGVAILCLAAVACGLWAIRSCTSPPLSETIRNDPVTLVDLHSGEYMTKAIGAWDALATKAGRYLNPNTNQYTMVVPVTCATCGTPVPPCIIPNEALEYGVEAMDAMRAAYRCPHCGGTVYR